MELNPKQTQNFIIAHGEAMTNEEMALKLGIERKLMAGSIAALKRSGAIEKTFLLSDRRGTFRVPKAKRIKKAKKVLFSNYNGEKKQTAREKVIEAIVNSGNKIGQITCLPADECIFEKLLIEKVIDNQFTFQASECEDKTFFKLCKNIGKNKLKMSVHRGVLSDVIQKQVEDENVHSFYDYCRTFDSHKYEIADTIKRKLVAVGGILAFTVSTRDNNAKNNYVQSMNLMHPAKKGETKTLNAIKMFLNLFMKSNYEIIETFSYKDTSPMLLVIIRRIS